MPTSFATLASQIALKSSSVATPSQALWNLQDTATGIDAASAWASVTGKGVSVAIFDDGAKHATAVSGLISAKPSAGLPLGVAYDASLTAFQVVGVATASIAGTMANAASFDVTNNSWGWDAALYVNKALPTWASFFASLTNAAEHGRDGLGTNQVVAAGNIRASGGDANLSNFTNDRHLITVGAVTSEGQVAAYSNPGASILVSAPSSGGARAITTTDLAGSAGYSAGDTTDQFGGTSAAAPQVSGTVALMLQANPNLGWRDVKTILAYSAEQPTGVATTQNGGSHWNGGGLSFSNDTGYGVINAHTAVRLAETWTAQSTSANELNLSVSASQTQSLSAGGSVSYSFNVTKAISVESAEITLQGSHGRVGDLTVQLVSPDGTVSTLLNHSGGSAAYQTFTLASNAYLGEIGTGQWSLRVSEGASGASGTFTGATLALHGADAAAADDTFVFTDAYAGGAVLHDSSGRGVINAAATTGEAVIDLHAGATSTLAGHSLQLGSDSLFKTAVAGDGHVTLIANDAGNVLIGGHGEATFIGGAGNDTFVAGQGHNHITGGAGLDTLVETGVLQDWGLHQQADGSWQLSRADGKLDVLSGVEQVQFADQTVALGPNGTVTTAAPLSSAAAIQAFD
ncbi:S8 family serine peptidase, partial [Methylobacterium nigriterrae]|uniref:S8 family serine peptidase n=1 Tax=Methylobacterium nigriterrae TaxID=3127512 RepID=UPI00301345F8